MKEDTLSIVKGAFENCCIGSGFEILCNDSLKSIGDEAFYHSNLKAIALPSELKSIGERCFADTNLHYVKIPDSIEFIPKQAFEKCGLNKIEWGYGVRIIGESAFANNWFEEFEFPYWIKEIGDSAFANASHYNIHYLSLPSSLKKIGAGAFANWELDYLDFCEYGALSYIGNFAFGSSSSVGGGPHSIIIPNTVTYLAPNAFSRYYYHEGGFDVDYDGTAHSYRSWTDGNKEILSSLVVGGGLETFEGLGTLKQLKHVELREGVKHIADYCFEGCEELESIILPTTLESVGVGAFWFCEKLEFLSFKSAIEELFISSIPINIKAIILPSGKLTLYITPRSKNRVEYLLNHHVFRDKDGNVIAPSLVFVDLKDGIWDDRPRKKDFEVIENGCYEDEVVDVDYGSDEISTQERFRYNQYGGYNDWDDDTINSAFEGDPEATWNVD